MSIKTCTLGWLLTAAIAAAPLEAAGDAHSPRPQPVSVERLSRLIQQLGDDDFFVRQRAQEELAQIGTPAFDALTEAEDSDDLEIADRARYLIRQLTVQWISETDESDARTVMEQYLNPDRPEEGRVQLIQVLGSLPDNHGVAPLCRLVRYEQSPVLSKWAALTVIEQPGTDDLWKARAKIIREGLGTSTRPAAHWLNEYLRTHGDRAAQAEVWKTLVDQEHDTLTQFPNRTSVELVYHLLRQQWTTLRALDRGKESVDVLRRMLALQPDDVNTLFETLQLLAEDHAWSVLDDAVQRHAQRFHDDPIRLYQLAQSALEGNSKDVAERIVQAARSLNDESAVHHLAVATKLQREGRFDWSEQEYRRCISIGGANVNIALVSLSELGEMLHDQQKEREAAAVFKDALKIMKAAGPDDLGMAERIPSTQSRMEYFLACDALAHGNMQQHQDHLLAGIKADPTDADVLIALYRLPEPSPELRERTLRLIREATDKFREQIEATPDDPTYYNQLAWLVSNTEGDQNEALECSKKSLEMKAGASGFLDTLGRCYYAQGDYENAVKAQSEAVEISPYSLQLKRQLALFEEALAKHKEQAGKK